MPCSGESQVLKSRREADGVGLSDVKPPRRSETIQKPASLREGVGPTPSLFNSKTFTSKGWSELTGTAAKVYLCGLLMSDSERNLTIKHCDFCEEAGVPDTTLRNSIRLLKKLDLIVYKQGLGRGVASEYHFPIHENVQFRCELPKTPEMLQVISSFNAAEVKLYGVANLICDEEKKFRVRVKRLAELSGICSQYIPETKQTLKARGLLKPVKRIKKVVVYKVLYPEEEVSVVAKVTKSGKLGGLKKVSKGKGLSVAAKVSDGESGRLFGKVSKGGSVPPLGGTLGGYNNSCQNTFLPKAKTQKLKTKDSSSSLPFLYFCARAKDGYSQTLLPSSSRRGAEKTENFSDPEEYFPDIQKKARGQKLSPAEEVAFLLEAQRILRTTIVSPTGSATSLGGRMRKLLKARLREGFTIPDMRRACKAAADAQDRGSAFGGMKNIFFVLGTGLPSLLASDSNAKIYRTGEDFDSWQESLEPPDNQSVANFFIENNFPKRGH
jgi:hypothetical protein